MIHLVLARSNRVFPLTLSIFQELLGGKSAVVGNLFYLNFPGSDPLVTPPSGIGFAPDDTYNKEGKYWQDLFMHPDLFHRGFLPCGRARIEYHQGKLRAFPLYQGSDKPIDRPLSSAPPMPENSPGGTFMKPMRDEQFVKRVIKSGTSYKIYSSAFFLYRWLKIFEIGAGLVAAEEVTGKSFLLACLHRYLPPINQDKAVLNQPLGWWEIPLEMFGEESLEFSIEEHVRAIRSLVVLAGENGGHDEIVYVPHQRYPELSRVPTPGEVG